MFSLRRPWSLTALAPYEPVMKRSLRKGHAGGEWDRSCVLAMPRGAGTRNARKFSPRDAYPMALTRRRGCSARSRRAVAHPGTVTFGKKIRRAVRARPWRPHARCRAPGPAAPHSGSRGGRQRTWRRSPAPRMTPQHPRRRAQAAVSSAIVTTMCGGRGSRTRRAPAARVL
jgi:hypothetical protein